MHNYFDSLFQIFFSSYFSSWGASSHSLYLLSLPLGGSLKIFFFYCIFTFSKNRVMKAHAYWIVKVSLEQLGCFCRHAWSWNNSGQ